MPIQILDKLYDEIEDVNIDNNANSYFYIIQIKNSNPDLSNHKNSIYVDIKKFVEYYILSIEKRDFGYDVLNLDKINLAINYVPPPEERLSLYLHTYKTLKNSHFENEAENIIVNIRKAKLLVLRTKKFKKKYINIFLHLISYNLTFVFLVLALIFVVSYVIFLPAPLNSFELIDFQYESFHENFYINHLFNIIYYLFDISNKVQINPINWGGVLLISGMKLFYFVCIVNYLYQIILERFKLNK